MNIQGSSSPIDRGSPMYRTQDGIEAQNGRAGSVGEQPSRKTTSLASSLRPLALCGLALLGLALRLYGLNWDQGNSFQPDERQIMFHVTSLSWPTSFAQFLDPLNSPLNPHFFAYGSFPLYLLAALGHILAHFFPTLGSFTNLTLVGRVVNAIFDSGTMLLTAWLGFLLTANNAAGDTQSMPLRSGVAHSIQANIGAGNPAGGAGNAPVQEAGHKEWSVALLAAALLAFTPFQLQLSHFYAVDTMLLFFITLTLLACVALVNTRSPLRWSLVAGLGYGLALATKFSAALLIVPLLLAVVLRWQRMSLINRAPVSTVRRLSVALGLLFSSLVTAGLVFILAMPYALLDWQNFYSQVKVQGDLARGLLDFPYVRQFAGTIPYFYEARNMLFWGMGLALGLAAIAGFAWLLWRIWRRWNDAWLVVLSWVVIYSAIVGSFYVKFMRYMLPVYPFLALTAAAVLVTFAYQQKSKGQDNTRTERPLRNVRAGLVPALAAALPLAAIILVLGGTAFQGLALLNVYSQPNTRIQASRWMYSHLRPGSVLTYEQWDDPLPVPVDNHDPSIFQQLTYPEATAQPQTGLDLYGDDTLQKAQLLSRILPAVDCITMATDRLDKSIPRLPQRYPLTIHYYQLLFSGQLGFYLAAKFENHPNLFGITLNDSSADESYSVFDHPTVRIFVRENPYPYTSAQLLQKLLMGVALPASTGRVTQNIPAHARVLYHAPVQFSAARLCEEHRRRSLRQYP